MDEIHRPLEMWFRTITDEIIKRRRQTAYRMTEADTRKRFGDDAVKMEGSLEIRRPRGLTSYFQRARS